jgi:mRNA-degrading endonuclease RelE of RelBE toxin-antitoxin system
MLSKKLVEKLSLVKNDLALINKLNQFISSIQKGDKSILKNSQLYDRNIYVYKIDGVRVFYSLQKDNTGNEVVVLLDFVHRNNLTKRIVTNNPKLNSTLNPKLNSVINPKMNSHINPKLNSRINPKLNSAINPKLNSSINPKLNSSINPKLNSSINPKLNSSINPKLSSQINPLVNPSFDGYYIYDLELNPIEYIIPANDEVNLIFNDKSDCVKFAVKHDEDGWAIFSFSNNDWLEHLESDGQTGYNLFNLNNEWIGFVK